MKLRRLLFVFVFFMLMIGVGSMDIKAAGSNEAFMVSAGPGSDASNSMTITWHSDIQGTFLLYAKKDVDPNFTDPFVANPETIAIEHFDPRENINHKVNKCVVRLENLDSGTEYVYKAGKTTFSPVKTFKTASNTESFSFLYISDYHVYNLVASRLQKAESVYAEAKKIDDIAFTLHGGDVVAYGSSYNYWESLMGSTFASEAMMAMTPGNHDFYNNQAQFIGVGYFNNILTNPNNGAENVKNSSYYFRYNNVLFVSIDNESSTQSSAKLASQQAWFRQIMEENPSQYVITYNHRPFYNGSTGNSGHANTNRTNWSSLFDEYGVDLVLSGHDHVYVRTKKTYNGQVSENENFGTVYITSPQIGDRPNEANPNSPYTNLDKVIGGNYSGGIVITVNPTNYTTTLVTDTGQILDTSKNYAKRPPIIYEELDRQEIVNNITAIYNGEDKIGKISLSGNDYLTVESMKVLKNNAIVVDKKIGVDDRGYTIYNPVENIKHDYTVEITFNDGVVLSKDVTMKTTPSYGEVNTVELRKELDLNQLYFSYNFINRQVAKYKVYLDDVLYLEDVLTDGEDSKLVDLEDIVKGQEYEVRLEVIDRLEDVVFTESQILLDPIIELEDLSVSVPEKFYLGENGVLEIVTLPENATYQDFIYTSSNPLVLTINNLGEYELLAVGETVVTVKEENTGIEKSFTVFVVKNAFGSIDELTVNSEAGHLLSIPYNFINNQVKKLDVYLNDLLFISVDVTDGEDIKTVNLGNLIPGNDYQVKVDVVDIFDGIVMSKEKVYSIPAILVTDLDFTYNNKMVIGEEQTLVVKVLPLNASYNKVTYLSLNPDILSISNGGKLTALKAGVATVKMGVENSEFTKSVNITVREKVTEITLVAPKQVRLGIKTDYVLEVELSPDLDVEVTFKSSDEDILTVSSDGTLHPRKAGEATITVSVDGVSETITINVLKQKGCANGAAILALLPMAFALIFFRRKKI